MREITSGHRLLVISHKQTVFCLFNVPLHLYSEGLIKVLSFLAEQLPTTLSHIFWGFLLIPSPGLKIIISLASLLSLFSNKEFHTAL